MMHNLKLRYEVFAIVKIHIVVLWVFAICSMVDISVLRNLTASPFRVSVVMLLMLLYKLMCTPLLNVCGDGLHCCHNTYFIQIHPALFDFKHAAGRTDRQAWSVMFVFIL